MSNTPGGVGPLNINIVISTTGAGPAAQQMHQVTNAASAMGSSMARTTVPARMMGDAMRQMTSLIKYGLLQGLMNLGTQSIQTARQFELSMSRIRGLVGISADQIDIYKQTVLDLGGQTAKTPTELAEALYFITSAGIKGSLALDVLKESARSAAAGLGETQVVADAITSTLNAYGGELYSASQANDILVATVREGKAEADQFAPALGKVLPVAAAFGASFEDVSAGVAALTRTGASAGTSAIYLRQVLSQLLKPSKQASDQMKAVGTSGEDLRRRIQEDGLLAALEYLNRALGGNEYEVASTGLTKVFGNVRALTAVFSLLGPNLEANREVFAKLNDSTGDAAVAFEAYSETADSKFRTATANAQAAIIRLGDVITPLITSLVEMSSRLAAGAEGFLKFIGGTSGFSKFVRVTLVAITALTLLARTALFTFGKFQTLFRLFNQTSIVFRGLTSGTVLLNGSVKSLTSTMNLFGVAQAEQQAITAAVTAATQGQAISQSQLLTIVAANTTNTRLQAAATAQASTVTAQNTMVNQANAQSYLAGALGVKAFRAALMSVVPYIGLVASIAFIAGDALGIFGKKGNDDLEEKKNSLSEVNSLLGKTVKLAGTGITIRVDLGEGETNLDRDKIIESLKKDLPKDIGDALSAARDDISSNIDRAQFGASILESFTYVSQKDKDMVAAALASVLSVDVNRLKEAAANIPTADISKTVSTVFINGLSLANKDVQAAARKADGPANIAETLQNIFAMPQQDQGDFTKYSQAITGAMQNIGKNVGAQLQKFGDISVLAESFKLISDSADAAGADAGYALQPFIQSTFEAISGTNDLKNEFYGLRAIFTTDENMSKLADIFTPFTGGNAEEAQQLVLKFRTELEKLGADSSPVEQSQAFARALDEYTSVAEAAGSTTGNLGDTVYDVANLFKEGFAPAIQEVVDEFNSANDAIKKFEEGQRAVMGIQRTFVESQIDAREALRGLTEDLGKSGGAIDTSVAGDKSKQAIIDTVDEILNVANAMATIPEAEGGGPAAAAKFITAGYNTILESVVKAGGTADEAIAFLDSINFKIKGAETPAEIFQTYFDRNLVKEDDTGIETLDKNLLNRIAEGVMAQAGKAAESASDGVAEFNNALLKQITDYWQIGSPSKKAGDEIGKPIAEGIAVGISSTDGKKKIENSISGLSLVILNGIKTALGIKSPSKEGVLIGRFFTEGVYGGINKGNQAVGDSSNRLGGAVARAYASGVAALYVDGETGKVIKRSIKSSTPTITDAAEDLGDKTIDSVFKGINKRSSGAGSLSKKITAAFAKAFKKAKDDVETPVLDLIDMVMSDSSDALSTIGEYIDAQIDLQKAIGENIKLANSQALLQDSLEKARRASSTATRKFGAQGGAEITDYEQAQIEDLQKTFEKVSRDYALRRASIADVIDAEEALNEARIAASETNSNVIESQNNVVDAEVALKTQGLETAKSIYDVVEAQKQLVESAINFKLNGAQAASVFQRFADQVFPGLEYRVSMATGTIFKAGVALTDDNGLFQKSLRGLGEKIFNSLQLGIDEAQKKSTVPEFFPKAEEPVPAPKAEVPRTPNEEAAIQFATIVGTSLFTSTLRNAMLMELPMFAQGGLVTKPTLGIVGEAGPELIVPLNGLGVTTALQNLTPNRQPESQVVSAGGQSINIIVNNPVPETASDSIGRRMRSLATAGLFG